MSFKCHSLISVWNLFQSHTPTLFGLEWFSGVTLYFLSNVAFKVAFSSFVFDFVSSFSNFSFWSLNFLKRCRGGILLLLYLAPSFPIRKEKFHVFCEEKILSYSAVLGMENIIFLRWLPLKLFMVFLALRYQFSSELQSEFTFQYLLTKLYFLQWTHQPQLSWTSMKTFLTPTWLGNVQCS